MSKWTETAIKCIEDEAKALLELIPNIDGDFDKTVELILNCKGKLVVTGVGKSGHIGAKIAATLSSTGTPSFFINPLDVFHGDLGVIQHDDVVLAISNSGQTDELLRFLPYLLENNIPVIGMSGNPHSLLVEYATAHLNAAVSQALFAESPPEFGLILACKSEKLVERHGVDAGLGNIILCTCLIGVHPFLNGKCFDLHEFVSFSVYTSGKRKDAQNPAL